MITPAHPFLAGSPYIYIFCLQSSHFNGNSFRMLFLNMIENHVCMHISYCCYGGAHHWVFWGSFLRAYSSSFVLRLHWNHACFLLLSAVSDDYDLYSCDKIGLTRPFDMTHSSLYLPGLGIICTKVRVWCAGPPSHRYSNFSGISLLYLTGWSSFVALHPGLLYLSSKSRSLTELLPSISRNQWLIRPKY